MNFFIFKFSRECRFQMALAFTILNLVQATLGMLIAGWSLYLCLEVSKHLYAEKAEITFVFTVTALYGTHIIFQYLMGIKICAKCFNKAHKFESPQPFTINLTYTRSIFRRSTKRHLYFWLAIGGNTLLNVLILSTMSVKISKHIVRSIRHSMEKGMRNYLKDPLWKHTIDRWQFHLQCCGVNNFKDWYEISWLDKYQLDVTSDDVQRFECMNNQRLQYPTLYLYHSTSTNLYKILIKFTFTFVVILKIHSLYTCYLTKCPVLKLQICSFLLSKDHLHLPVVPWSCCDINFPMQCFHDPLQQIQSAHLWKEQPEFLDGTIYNKGCLTVLREPIEASLVGLIIVTSILIINQVIAIIVISRLLYTSCRNAVVLRDVMAPSPGWLFGRDCFSATKGRTVSEVMFVSYHRIKRTKRKQPNLF
ncbi:PREDICTED: LOW QUALITY PROTEIN: uncharacterized protein LOC108559904 [Nicrophorus vespilloides]|uniref:LOW QUALITY PROTEIN: uncharacterized protein LOC108559904 n=1 Tax=Nicrophorus vespilloides TaxID=110193 RepID=A0ABM1MDW8_NICVS|nr:PREDICTED: LOW QUALITY PROTEIN: uncharacterized protein LOC108559904 [Nicrophorus vespilloides]